MNKKKIIRIGTICVLFLLLAFYIEATDHFLKSDNTIERLETGQGDEEFNLILNADGLEKNYKYPLTVEEIRINSEEADKIFEKAKQEIDKTIFINGEKCEYVTCDLNVKDQYADGMVQAEWSFDGSDAIDTDGNIIEENVIESGSAVMATVQLTCFEYKQEYIFSFCVYPKKLTRSEKLIKDIKGKIKDETDKYGESKLELPKEVDGVKLRWSEPKRYLVLKVLLFEVVILILLKFSKIEREKDDIKKKIDSMKLDYSDIVSKMCILIGAGMSIKQAWNRISASYLAEREKSTTSKRPAYEEMLITTYEMQDGESERIAYQRFGERVGINEYNRFSRILVQSMQKGNSGICAMLEKEAEESFEQRKVLARKLGEEASTKMLIPLMLMLGIVIAIVIVPAVISF